MAIQPTRQEMPAGADTANAGSFTNVPPQEDLSSNVVGLSVYNNDNKDI